MLRESWYEVYEAAEIERYRGKRADETQAACKALGVAVGYGNNVVTFCHDAHFAT